MQKNDETLYTLSRARSTLMRQTLSSLNIKTDPFIVDGEEYRIVDSEFRNWISIDQQKMASVGGKVFGREILLINPYIGNVAAVIKSYRYSLLHKQLIKQTYTDQEIINLLTDLSIFVSQLLKPDAAAVQGIIDVYKKNTARCLASNNQSAPFIDLEIFLTAKVGVCRHYAIFCCLIAADLISRKLLPAGQIIHERTNLINSAHACMHYIYGNKHLMIDPTKCISQSTAYLAVTSVDREQAEEPLTPTQPISPPTTPTSSQNCEFMDECEMVVEKIIASQTHPIVKVDR